jgi:NADPH-dependent glutamate synthase beta subunit-like oxidoreductase/NAD-dependent dihydropyrimidine dehydrogenase PreA subunit
VDARYQATLPSPRYFLDLISCRSACPVRTNAGAYVRAVAEGQDRRGYEIARAPNPWVSVCAHVCAHPCESRCRRGAIDQPISIRALKRTLTERHGVESVVAGAETSDLAPLGLAARIDGEPARVAVVGAGPAGLACAHDLAYLGYRVSVFEAAPVLGGMLYQGIPEYRLPRDIIRAEIDRTVRLGVEIKTNWRLGRDYTVDDLFRNGFASVFLAFGATRGRDLQVPGGQLDGVINGVDFLLNANLGYHVALGSRVVIVGGGNVAIDVARTVLRYGVREEAAAMPPGAEALLESWGYDNTLIDAARTALRLGARQVTVVSLERRHEMPASREEITQAEEEGIHFVAGRGPKQFLGQDGKVVALETVDVASVFDANGRFNPTFVESSERRIEADTVILAIGQKPDLTSLAGDPDIAVTPRGLVQVDPKTLATTAPGVFCGGDLAFGPRIIIDATGDGKRAALAIHRHLGGPPIARSPLAFRTLHLSRWAEDYDRIARQDVPCLPVQRRVGFREVELDYPEAQARTEGRRCLWCNVSPIFDSDTCILCGGCVDICPENCLKLVRADRLAGAPAIESIRTRLGVSEAGGAILKDEERCSRCGLCADRCPTGAITMELLEVDNSPAASLQLFAEEMEDA